MIGAPGKMDSVAALPHPCGARYARPKSLRDFVELVTRAFGAHETIFK